MAAEEPQLTSNVTSPSSDSVLLRAERLTKQVEQVINQVGEVPTYEFKRRASFKDTIERIELIKDIQSIATSRIDNERFLVIGVDAAAKAFVTVANIDEFDEADVRKIVAKYLDPVPVFEIFNLRSSTGAQYVAFVFPKQPTRRIVAKVTVDDPNQQKPKVLLREGDLWTKGQSTGKRLATPADWDDIYEDAVEREAERRTRQRTAHFLERVIAEERVRSGPTSVRGVASSSDQELVTLVEGLCVSNDFPRFNALIEQFRDELVESWHSTGAFAAFGETAIAGHTTSEILNRVREHRKNVIEPATSRLTAVGIQIIKSLGPTGFLSRIVDLFAEMLETTQNLVLLRNLTARGSRSQSAADHISHTALALEALISLHALGAYAAKRKRFQYTHTILTGPAVAVAGPAANEQPSVKPIAFWPLQTGWGEPQALYYRAGRIEVCTRRILSDPTLSKYFGSEVAIVAALCQHDFVVEFNSYLAVDEKATPKTVEFMKARYPAVDFGYWDSFIAFGLEHIIPLVSGILNLINGNSTKALAELLIDPLELNFVIPSGEQIFGTFLHQIEYQKSGLAQERRSFYFGTDWPPAIQQLLARTTKSG